LLLGLKGSMSEKGPNALLARTTMGARHIQHLVAVLKTRLHDRARRVPLVPRAEPRRDRGMRRPRGHAPDGHAPWPAFPLAPARGGGGQRMASALVARGRASRVVPAALLRRARDPGRWIVLPREPPGLPWTKELLRSPSTTSRTRRTGDDRVRGTRSANREENIVAEANRRKFAVEAGDVATISRPRPAARSRAGTRSAGSRRAAPRSG
jgi:hypothetical protein